MPQFVNTSAGNAWTISGIVYNKIIKNLSRKKTDTPLSASQLFHLRGKYKM